MNLPTLRSVLATMTAALGAALLTGCFMIPGKFDAKLDLRSDGEFTYAYVGEIRFLGLTQLAEMADGPGYNPEWSPENERCWGEVPAAQTTPLTVQATAAEQAVEVRTTTDTPPPITVTPVPVSEGRT